MEAAQAEVPGLSLATVYRNLKQLIEAGEIASVSLPGDSPRYESAQHSHHHHFQCTECQRVFDVHECPGDMTALAPAGFTVERHELTLYGRCSDCAAATAKARRPAAAKVHGKPAATPARATARSAAAQAGPAAKGGARAATGMATRTATKTATKAAATRGAKTPPEPRTKVAAR